MRAMKDHIVEKNARIYECEYTGLGFNNSEVLRLQFQDTRTHKKINRTSCSRLVVEFVASGLGYN